MTPSQIQFVTALIGRPYVLGANGPDQFDCYGLVRFVQEQMVGHRLPDINRDVGPSAIPPMIRAAGERQRWERVDQPKEFDVVLMANVQDRSTHMGLWVRPAVKGAVLHAWEKSGVSLHDLATLRAAAFGHIRYFRRKLAA